MAIYYGGIQVSGGEGGGGGSADPGLSSQISAHDADIKTKLLEQENKLSAHGQSVAAGIDELKTQIAVLKQNQGNQNCLDWSTQHRFVISQYLSAASVPYDCRITLSTGNAPAVTIDGHAADNIDYGGAALSVYNFDVAAGVRLNVSKTPLLANVTVTPFRYGNKVISPTAQQTASFQSVFKSAALAGIVEPVSAYSFLVQEDTQSELGVVDFAPATGAVVPWDNDNWGSYVDQCYEDPTTPSDLANKRYRYRANMTVVLRAAADKNVILSYSSTMEPSSSGVWNQKPAPEIKYFVGSAPSDNPTVDIVPGQLVSLAAGQYITIRSKCWYGSPVGKSAGGNAATVWGGNYDEQGRYGLLYHCKPSQFFTNLTVSTAGFDAV